MTLEVVTAGQKVRSFLEKELSWSSDLTGACAIGSFLVWKLLQEYKPTLVVGDAPDIGHCWVKVRGKVIDVTATQFGDYPPVLVLPIQKYYKLDFVKQFTSKLTNENGLESLKEDWPKFQTPWAYSDEVHKHLGFSI